MKLTQHIKDRFGSKRGLVKELVHTLFLHMGFYKHLQKVPIKNVRRYVFICYGNICRSPLAEYAAKQHGANAISFGLHTRGADKADERAIDFALTMGIDLSPHATRPIDQYIPQDGDLLVGMEPKHAKELQELFGDRVAITLAGLWHPKKKAYIHDPYNASLAYFNTCEKTVLSCVDCLVKNPSAGM
jgi:protein-tyrosine-phosphatase